MSVVILGAGGHAKVVADILLAMQLGVRGYLDDNPTTWGKVLVGIPVLGPLERLLEIDFTGVICAIGANAARQKVVERLGASFADHWINAIHPSAVIGYGVHLGKGVVAAAGAVINVDSTIGNHVIINTGATVDHDCEIRDYTHIAPGSHLAGGVTVGTGALIGVGTAIIPGRCVGAWSVIGAGATVVRDIPAGVTAKGIPARWQE